MGNAHPTHLRFIFPPFHLFVTSMSLPQTIANVTIIGQCWNTGEIKGKVNAGDYEWCFQWHFRQGKLSVKPTLGRSLIQESLCRFLERYDYQLEVGGDYQFCLRAKL